MFHLNNKTLNKTNGKFCRSLEELYLDMYVGDSADDQVSMDDFSFGIEKLQLQVNTYLLETTWKMLKNTALET